jgi:N-acetylmuramoyl-L-alanine amidase
VLSSSILCLALTVYIEARSQPIKSQIAVAAVTVNRTRSKGFPKTVCEVVKQPGQYQWVKKNKRYIISEVEAYNKALEVSKQYLKGNLPNPIGPRLFFNNTSLGKVNKSPYTTLKIKDMVFY